MSFDHSLGFSGFPFYQDIHNFGEQFPDPPLDNSYSTPRVDYD